MAHEPCLQSHHVFAHVTLDFFLGGEGCHRVDDEDVDGARACQFVDNLQGLLAVVGLAHPQVVDVHAEFCGIGAVESVLGIDKCGDATFLLHLCDGVEREGCFTR